MASFTAFPLRFRDAFLRRTEEVEAIVQLFRVMAVPPHGSWAGCAHFGWRDFFERARVRPELISKAVEEANSALRDLGITHYRVAAITKAGDSQRDIDSYEVSIISTEAGAEAIRLQL